MRRWALAVLLCLAWTACAQAAGKRVALVIGNGAYTSVERLRNPANDARLIAKTLKGLGFELVSGDALTDLSKPAMAHAIQEFGRSIAGADVALFYYSGHGLQVQGTNWLIPVDANLTRPQDLDFQAVDADLVLRQMDGVGTRLNVVILDACRNNPFAITGMRGGGGGLAEMRAPDGTLISYATQPGAVAWDGGGANSPYTQALVSAMQQPGLDVFRTFNRVGLQVKRETGGAQQPWVSNSPIDGDFTFAGLVPQAAPVPSSPAPPQPVPPETPPTTPPSAPSDQRAATPCPPALQRAIHPFPHADATGCGPAEPPKPPRPAAANPSPPLRQPASTPPRRPATANPRCGDLLARAQLGEPLGAADRVALAGCGG